MNLSQNNKKQEQLGRVIAQGMEKEKVVKEKNMIKAEKRKATMLENAAQIALSGGVKG